MLLNHFHATLYCAATQAHTFYIKTWVKKERRKTQSVERHRIEITGHEDENEEKKKRIHHIL